MALDAHVLILSDGKMGDLAQCRGVAQMLTAPQNITEHVVKPKGFWALPVPLMPVAPLERQNRIFDEPLPDIVIASGRRTVPYIRAFAKMPGKPFTVFLKDPRHSRGSIDFIWAPEHDGLKGSNVFSTLTAPHTISRDTLGTMGAASVIELGVDGPAAGIVLGGNSGQVTWTEESALVFAAALNALPGAVALVIIASRRTPGVLRNALEEALPNAIWPERLGIEQPYIKTLAISEHLIVTGDSHNMVSEALATGAAVYVHRPPGLNRKLVRFLDALEKRGLIANLQSGFARGRQEPVNATPLITAEIERRYTAWLGTASTAA